MKSEVEIALDELKKAMHKYDLIVRPYIAFMNPDDVELFKKVNPFIEKKIVLQPTPWIEKGKVYVMKRRDLEINYRNLS